MAEPQDLFRASRVTVALVTGLLSGIGALSAAYAGPDAFGFEAAGARVGVGANRSSRDFVLGEGFTRFSLPWLWRPSDYWTVRTKGDASAGWLGEHGVDAAITSAGPTFTLEYRQLPVQLEAGTGLTLLSRSEFPTKDLGAPIQLTTHIGVAWKISAHWCAQYRFQHSSNGGISAPNPGLNLHTFALSYLF